MFKGLMVLFLAAPASNAVMTSSTFFKYKILILYHLRPEFGAIFPEKPWISEEIETGRKR